MLKVIEHVKKALDINGFSFLNFGKVLIKVYLDTYNTELVISKCLLYRKPVDYTC